MKRIRCGAFTRKGEMSMPELLEVRDLKKYFPVTGGFLKKTVGWVKAVDGVI